MKNVRGSLENLRGKRPPLGWLRKMMLPLVLVALVYSAAAPDLRAQGELYGGTCVRVPIDEPAVFPDGTCGFTSGKQGLWRIDPGTSFKLGAATINKGEYMRVDFIIVENRPCSVSTITIMLGPRYDNRETQTLRTSSGCTVKIVANSARRTAVVARLEARLGTW